MKSYKQNQEQLKNFQELVAMKYQIYNGLFVTLPFEKLENTETLLALFLNNLKDKLEAKASPVEIVENFLVEAQSFIKDKNDLLNSSTQAPLDKDLQVLFGILQFVERQVVLFDALEEAAFEEIKDLKGPGTIEYFLNKTEETGQSQALIKNLKDYKIRPVLTAHPTQFYPSSVLGILADLAEAIRHNKLNDIHDLLMQMGKTKFKNRSKPTPLDEAKSLLWYLENIFYKVMPQIQLQIQNATNTSKKQQTTHLNPMVELGFWPGGDRDGNPFVKASTTQDVLSMLKSSVLKLYLLDVKNLQRRLTFDGIHEKLALIETKLTASQQTLTHPLPSTESSNKSSGPTNLTSDRYSNSQELLSDLQEIKELLINNHQGLFLEKLEQVIHKIEIFGFHFATLDLRQDSRIHTAVLNELLSAQDYSTLLPDEQSQLNLQIIQGNLTVSIPSTLSEIAQDTLNYLSFIPQVQLSNGEKALNRYIISNSNSSSNILELACLMTIANQNSNENHASKGPKQKEHKQKGLNLNIDIVPLFETIEDLQSAQEIMQELYENPFYQSQLAKRQNTQTIMLGFSDGTKDGGYFTANWNIYLAKQKLTHISRKYGIKVIFFDGRGGPPARGGGNTNEFYRSMGKSIEQDQIQLTIQGQTISSNYGSLSAASYNLEQLFTAGLEKKIFPAERSELDAADFELMQTISDESLKAYLNLRNDPLFVSYLEEVTPLRFYDMLNFASRPSKRNKDKKLKFEDLRAISFVGAWTQMKQNIAGYYGLGSGLQAILQQGKLNELNELYKKSLFFRTLLENAMQSLTKSFFPLTYYLEKDKKFGKFWQKLQQETELTQNLIRQVSGQAELMEQAALSKQSITLREKIVLPLLVIQHYALCKLRDKALNEPDNESSKTEALQKIVIKSLAANINASRNSV